VQLVHYVRTSLLLLLLLLLLLDYGYYGPDRPTCELALLPLSVGACVRACTCVVACVVIRRLSPLPALGTSVDVSNEWCHFEGASFGCD
jgi:hypothetical protein